MNSAQVEVGYKQTEVGVIPEDWEVQRLDEIAKLERGKFSARPRNDPKFFGGNIPFIQTGDVTKSKGIITSYSQTLNEQGLSVSKLFPKNTLFFTIAANIGDLGIASFKTACPDSLIAILPKPNTEKSWLFQALKSRKLEFEGLATQNAQLNINLEKLNPYLLSLPPLPEQRAIAQALSDVDALIASLDNLIAKQRQLKTAAMQQLLTGKMRLPGFGEGKGYKHTEVGLIPEDWDIKTYGDIFTFLTTANNSRADLSFDEEVKYIHYGDIHTKWDCKLDLLFETLPSISQEKIKGTTFLDEGDVVMADASEDYEGIGKSVEIVNVRDSKVIAGLHTFLLRDKNGIFVNGFRRYLHTIKVVKMSLDRMATGLKVYGISKNNLKTILIPVPGKKEQSAIATFLSDMDTAIAALETRRAKTQAIKQGMMQELLTGRTRLV